MAYDWKGVQTRVNTAVEKFGGKSFLVRGVTSYKTKFIIGDFRPNERPGDFISETDLRVFISVGSLPVEPNRDTDAFKFDEDIFIGGRAVRLIPIRIVTCKPINPSGVTLIYDMIVRR
jgi:hypothetical protein